jgi:prolyl oligopeptidase
VAYRLPQAGTAASGSPVAVLFTPDAKSSIDEVAAGADAVYASIYHDVTGSVHAFRPDAQGHWSDAVLPMPADGSTHIVSVNAWGPQALYRFESFTVPTTLYADSGNGKPAAIKSLPARFDASNIETQQFFATSKDGTRVPYFVTRPKNLKGPAPTVLYGYGGSRAAGCSSSPISAAAASTGPAGTRRRCSPTASAPTTTSRPSRVTSSSAASRRPSSSASWAARTADCW